MAQFEQFADPAGASCPRVDGAVADVGTVIERMRTYRSHWPPGTA